MRRIVSALVALCLLAAGSSGLPSWRFAVFGDNRGNPKDGLTPGGRTYLDGGVNVCVLEELAKQIAKEKVDFALNIGDLVSKWKKQKEGQTQWADDVTAPDLLDRELDLWQSIWLRASGHTPLFPIRGNHEATPRNKDSEEEKDGLVRVWKNHFPYLPYQTGPLRETGLTYVFKHKNALFVCIDQYEFSRDPSVPTVQNDWLKSILKSCRAQHIFVLGHTPAFPSVDEALPDLQKALPTPGGEIDPEAVVMRNKFWDLLSRAGVRLYFCGHQHMYARAFARAHGPIWPRQIIVGAGGAPLDPVPELLYIDNYEISCLDDSCTYKEIFPPRVYPMTDDIDNGRFGYLSVEVKGPWIRCTYKAAPFEKISAGKWKRVGPFQVVDRFCYVAWCCPYRRKAASLPPAR